MADTFEEQLEEDLANAFLNEFADPIVYRVASTGVETAGTAQIEEQVGALDSKADQLFRIAVSFVAVPVPGDQVQDPSGNWWTVVKVRTEQLMHELRCFLPELVT